MYVNLKVALAIACGSVIKGWESLLGNVKNISDDIFTLDTYLGFIEKFPVKITHYLVPGSVY